MIDGMEKKSKGDVREFWSRCGRAINNPAGFLGEVDSGCGGIKVFYEKSTLPENKGFENMLKVFLWFENADLFENLTSVMCDMWEDFVNSTESISKKVCMEALDMSREMLECFIREGILKSWQKGRGKGKRTHVVKSDIEMLQALARERPEHFERLCEAIEEGHRFRLEGFQGRKIVKKHWARPAEMTCTRGAETGGAIFSDDSIFIDNSLSGRLDRIETSMREIGQDLTELQKKRIALSN